MSELKKEICEILNESQEITFNFDLGLEQFHEIILKYDQDLIKIEFISEIQDCIDILLTTSNNYKSNYIIEFLAEFIASLNRNRLEQFIQTKLLEYLMNNLRSSVDLVRERICDLTNKILKSLTQVDQSGEIETKLFSLIQTNLVERFRDSNEKVQLAAIKASVSLQEPHNKSCPVINELIYLLRNYSNLETRLLILDSIVINKQSFNFIKSELFYDTEPLIRQKVLSVLCKKLPNKFMDSKLKKQIIDCLLRDKKIDLIENYLVKWSENKRLNLIEMLNLTDLWYSDLSLNEFMYQHDKLMYLMNIYFKLEESMLDKVTQLNNLLAEEDVFANLNVSFHFCSLIYHALNLNQIEFVNKHLIIDLDHFEANLNIELKKENKSQLNVIILFHLIDSLSKLTKLFDALKYLNLIKCSQNASQECLLSLLVNKLEKNDCCHFMLELVENNDEIDEKCLRLLSLIIAKFDQNDFEKLELVTHMDMNIIEYLVTNVISKSITHLDSVIRSLSVRCLGAACLTSQYIAQSYIEFLIKIFRLDYDSVIHECLKVLFDISLEFIENQEMIDASLWKTLEKQLDCLSDLKIQFIAYEGVSKLLLKNFAKVPNNSRLLLKLLNGFFSETLSFSEEDENLKTHKLKLKACLSCFFDLFTRRLELRNELAKLSVSYIDIAFNNPDFSMEQIKDVAHFFYYYSFRIQNHRQMVISALIDRVNLKIRNQFLVEKWIDILLVFDVNDCDLDLDNLDKSMQILNDLYTKLDRLIELIEAKKWKISNIKDLKQMSGKIKCLLNKHIKKRHSEDILEETFSQTLVQKKTKIFSDATNKTKN